MGTFNGLVEESPGEQQRLRFERIGQALNGADSAEKMAEILRENKFDVEEMRRNIDVSSAYYRGPSSITVQDLLYDWATTPIFGLADEVYDAQQEVAQTVLRKLKEFGYEHEGE